jgi:hypothetical protein
MIIVHNTVFSAFPRLTREGPWSALARAMCIQSAAFFTRTPSLTRRAICQELGGGGTPEGLPSVPAVVTFIVVTGLEERLLAFVSAVTHCVQRCRPLLPLLLICTGGVMVQGHRRGGAKRQRQGEVEADGARVLTADGETGHTCRRQKRRVGPGVGRRG